VGNSSVQQGRLNLAQDVSPGLNLKGRPVPKGRLEIRRDVILSILQPSLQDLNHVARWTQDWRPGLSSAVPAGLTPSWFAQPTCSCSAKLSSKQ
jgi:hypothetical protein